MRAFTPAGNGRRECPDVFHKCRFFGKERDDRRFISADPGIEGQFDGLGKFREASCFPADILYIGLLLCAVDGQDYVWDP